MQGDCTGQRCSRDGRTHLSEPAPLSCGFMALMLMELLSERAHVMSGHGCLCNTERLPSDLPALLVAMEQDSLEWPGAIQQATAGSSSGSLSSPEFAREVLLWTDLSNPAASHMQHSSSSQSAKVRLGSAIPRKPYPSDTAHHLKKRFSQSTGSALSASL